MVTRPDAADDLQQGVGEVSEPIPLLVTDAGKLSLWLKSFRFPEYEYKQQFMSSDWFV